MKNIEKKQLVLEELRSVYERMFSASDALDAKLQNILNFLSVVVSIAPTLELMIIPDLRKTGLCFVILLLTVLVLYLISFQKVKSSINPVYYKQPISKDWDEIKERYFLSKKDEVIDLTISQYLYSLSDMDKKLNKKIKAIESVSKLMAGIVLLLLVAIPVDMFFPAPTLSDLFHFISQIKF